jgi:hypothetical protein
VRRGIEAVQRGERPEGVYFSAGDVPPTFANDLVVAVDEVGGDPDDGNVLLQFAESLAARYTATPPMVELAARAAEAS